MAQTRRTNSKYQAETMLPALRHFVEARNFAVREGLLTDNGGAIHSIERILDIMSLRVCYPHVSHYNSLKKCPNAHRSVEAENARRAGESVEIEHLLPKRAYSQLICGMIADGASDEEILTYIKTHFRLVLLTQAERKALDKVNRSKLDPERLQNAGIAMHFFD